MTWLHIPKQTKNSITSPYSLAQGENSLPANGLRDGERSATSSEKNTQSKASSPESKMAIFMMHPSGTTFAASQSAITKHGDSLEVCGKFGTVLLSQPDSHANHSVLRESGIVRSTNGMGGRTPFVLLEKFDPDTPFSKMSEGYCRRWIRLQMNLFTTTEPFCETWPKSGTMQNGACYRLPAWGHYTVGTDCGSLAKTYRHLFPTPTKATEMPCANSNTTGPKSLTAVMGTNWMPGQLWPTPSANSPGWVVGGDVTPVDKNGEPPSHINQRWYDKETGRLVQKGLEQVIKLWPTPTVSGNHNKKGSSENSGDGLATAVNLYPTPSATDWKGAGKNGKPRDRLDYAIELGETKTRKFSFATPQARDWRGGEAKRWHDPNRSRNLNDQVASFPTPAVGKLGGGSGNYHKLKRLEADGVISEDECRSMVAGNGGKLNPDWVEWLMGWPIGWTDLRPLSAERFLEWLAFENWWQREPDGIPRITDRRENRVSRLKAIGNGQVPQSAHVAWGWLMADKGTSNGRYRSHSR